MGSRTLPACSMRGVSQSWRDTVENLLDGKGRQNQAHDLGHDRDADGSKEPLKPGRASSNAASTHPSTAMVRAAVTACSANEKIRSSVSSRTASNAPGPAMGRHGDREGRDFRRRAGRLRCAALMASAQNHVQREHEQNNTTGDLECRHADMHLVQNVLREPEKKHQDEKRRSAPRCRPLCGDPVTRVLRWR